MTAASKQQHKTQWLSLLLIVPIAVALTTGIYLRTSSARVSAADVNPLHRVVARGATSLRKLFKAQHYTWPPTNGVVPALALRHLPINLSQQPVSLRKSLFFRSLLPIVMAANRRVAKQRVFIMHQFARPQINDLATRRLHRIANRYGVTTSLRNAATRQQLLRRVDTIPPALVLAQAAMESGWGSSRFSREANNLFGIWTWNARAGLAPNKAAAGGHYVRKYTSLRASVDDYLYNLNVGHAYLGLRTLRARLRHSGAMPSALHLVTALERYSEKGKRYVLAIRDLIVHNKLTALHTTTLHFVEPNTAALPR